MKILYLGPSVESMIAFLRSFDDEVVCSEEPISPESAIIEGVDIVVSYRYQHIIRRPVIEMFPNRIINLHISLLPWNRGADPNLWSFLEDTPKGVSIHYIDSGVDTGPLIAQKQVEMLPDDTLATSYERLTQNIKELFFKCWSDIRNGLVQGINQAEGGSAHRMKDKRLFEHFLSQGWDTPVRSLIGQALVCQAED